MAVTQGRSSSSTKGANGGGGISLETKMLVPVLALLAVLSPPSLEEAAMVDGASRFQAFYRVALPLVTPGIVTTAILCLVFS